MEALSCPRIVNLEGGVISFTEVENFQTFLCLRGFETGRAQRLQVFRFCGSVCCAYFIRTDGVGLALYS